eukprot:m.309508 g.309508  ORF g.309508 m.309508 type:complete len:293 (-) comp23180_c0_seq1:87-965(-)
MASLPLIMRSPGPSCGLRRSAEWPTEWIVPGWAYSEADHAVFEQEGYWTSKNFLTPEALAFLRDRVDGVLRDMCIHVDLEWVMSPHQFLPARDNWLWALATQPAVLDLVERQLGPNLVLFSAQLAVKPPCRGHVVPWHQDGERCRTLWIPLDDISPETGGLRVKPRWHKKGRLRFRHVASPEQLDAAEFFSNYNLYEVDVGEGLDEFERDIVEYRLPAGAFEVHHPSIPHSSQPNTSTAARRVIILRYQPDTEPLVGGAIHDFARCRDVQKVNYFVRGSDAAFESLATQPRQ